jgi:hypothetical protein
MKKTTKKLQKFIDSISNVIETDLPGIDDVPNSYVSKIDGSYLTFVGLENDLNFLLKFGVTDQIQSGFKIPSTSNIGFNPTAQKWYGWSHRAIYGFGIGGECKKGSCGYNADNAENFANYCLDFWGKDEYSVGDDKFEFVKGMNYDNTKEVDGVLVSYTYNDKVPNEELRGTRYNNFTQYPDKWGRGEWVAKNINDAKEMAIDFAKGVS